MPEEQYQDPVNSLLAEFGTRLNEVEEKQRLIRDRALLIGENLVETKQEFDEKNFEVRNQLEDMKKELRELKQLLTRVINEIPHFARTSDLEILESQYKMFQPLELTTKSEVEAMIHKTIKKK